MLRINHNTLFPFCSLCVNVCSQCVALQPSSFFQCPTVSRAKEELRENQSKRRLGEAAGSRADIPQPSSRGGII